VYFGTPFLIFSSDIKTLPWYSDVSRQTFYIEWSKKIKENKMTTQLKAIKMNEKNTETTNPSWRTLYRVGGIAALGTVLVGLVEIGITFLPGATQQKKLFSTGSRSSRITASWGFATWAF
jgi:hypothetical protein